jgi:hypothetical protein
MTRSSAIWVTGVKKNDLGDDKPTSSRASISLPAFEDTRDDDDEEEDFFDAEAGWYVPVGYRYLRCPHMFTFAELEVNLLLTRQKDSRDFMPRSLAYIISCPTYHLQKYFDEGLRYKKISLKRMSRILSLTVFSLFT